MTSISPDELKRKMEAGRPFVLLDVREDDERAFCAIAAPEAVADVHIPMRQIPQRLKEIQKGDSEVVVYCHHGVRSLSVAHWLEAQGMGKVINLEGGIEAWSVRVDPKVRRY